MIDKVGSDLWGYSRAHMAYALFMYGFGVGYRLRALKLAGTDQDTAMAIDIMAWRGLKAGEQPESPWDGGFRYGWRFESLGGADG